ncbi:recombinase family protein [Pseudonocardia tropica]|uniref:Recombinase family protein n=1 Tax=Pseudonocardia tropica TaxID=681289 RepID=A0ABV1JS80_9PSEU
MTGTRRRVLYGRTSVDRSEGKSVDDQLSELREWAEDDESEVVGEFRDDGVSVSRYSGGREREGWAAVRALIVGGDVDEVAVWEGSRTTRKIVESSELLDLCALHGVRLAVRSRVYDPSDPDDRARLLHDAVDAEHESGRISKRVARRAKKRAALGAPNGRVNFGYRVVRDPVSGKAVGREPDPETAPAVREAVARLLAGESAGAIARDFQARGIQTRSGTVWTGPNLLAMVKRPVYAGIRTSAVHELPDDHPGTWEALVSKEDHDRLVAMLADPSRKAIRTGEHIKHLLSGVAECGKCHSGRIRTISRTSRRTGSRSIAYTCSDCHGVNRPAEATDAYVSGVVVKFLSRPDVAEQLADPADDHRAESRAEAARQRRKLAEIEAQIDADVLDVATGSRLLRATRERLAAAEAGARPAHVPDAVLDMAGPGAGERWEALSVPIRREIIRTLFRVVIERGVVGGLPVFHPETITIERRRR